MAEYDELSGAAQSRRDRTESADTAMYWEWLCSIPGLYRPQLELLLHCFGDPEGVWQATEAELQHLQQKGYGWTGKVLAAQRSALPEKTVYEHRNQGIHFISCIDPDYPTRLLQLQDKPWGLFLKGKIPDPGKKAVAIVGARMCTREGKLIAEEIARYAALAGGNIISGAAYGIDGAAQWTALCAGGESTAVLGCGVDRIYPASHRRLYERLQEQGSLISEFPPGTPPMRGHFPMRNRIISGLADVVVVVEARRKSGSLITAEFAAEQGRNVYAVPGRPGDELSEGCNELIAQGAGIILSPKSFTEEIFRDFKAQNNEFSEKIALAPTEKLVYSSFGLHAKSVWELEECTALSPAELSNVLLILEEKGLVRESERNYYIRVK